MSRRKQQRESANPHEQATLTTNEKILKECFDLYTSQDHGNYKYVGVIAVLCLCVVVLF